MPTVHDEDAKSKEGTSHVLVPDGLLCAFVINWDVDLFFGNGHVKE
jgi:hypothetical protein